MKVLYPAQEIAQRVKILAQEITKTYSGCELTVIGILKGSFIFLSDLVRAIDMPLQIDFATLSSYGNADCPQGEVKILNNIKLDITGRHVLLVDDILDTGESLSAYKRYLEQKGPASVRICTMVNKTCRRSAAIQPDFYGFRIEDGFVVGYGLDYAEQYRALPDICVLEINSNDGEEYS